MTVVRSAEAMRDLGARLGARLRTGDVLVLAGPVGAGKTTLTQGIGLGLGVHEQITSPTFVIAREYQGHALRLVHIDAYRLGSRMELDDLDIDSTNAVVVIEWGLDVAAALSHDPLVIEIAHGSDSDTRVLTLPADPRLADLVG